MLNLSAWEVLSSCLIYVKLGQAIVNEVEHMLLLHSLSLPHSMSLSFMNIGKHNKVFWLDVSMHYTPAVDTFDSRQLWLKSELLPSDRPSVR